MITRLDIEAFRGIDRGSVEALRPLTILVGPNGSGKSSILDAVLIGAATHPARSIADAALRCRDLQDPARWLVPRASTEARARIRVETAEARRETRVWTGKLAPGFHRSGLTQGPYVRVHFEIDASADGAPETQEPAWQPDAAGTVDFGYDRVWLGDDAAPPALISRVALVDPPNKHAGSGTKARGNELALRFNELRELGRAKEASELVKVLAPGRTGLELGADSSGAVVLCAGGDQGSLPVALLGSGLAHLVPIALELGAASGGLVLLEEPETHLYPPSLAQLAKLVVAAVDRGTQILLATHDLELIDMLLVEVTALARRRARAGTSPAASGEAPAIGVAEPVAEYETPGREHDEAADDPREDAAIDELFAVVQTSLRDGVLNARTLRGSLARTLRWDRLGDVR